MSDEWLVEYTDEFEAWWDTLAPPVQEKVSAVVELLEEEGPRLGFPYSSEIKGTESALRELRVQYAGRPYRILYAFDPVRAALLLIGGDKTGNNRWYEQMIPIAERLFKEHLMELKESHNERTS